MMDHYHATACQKAALDTGFTRELGGDPPAFQAPVAEGTIRLSGAGGTFAMQIDHPAAAADMGGAVQKVQGAAALTLLLGRLHGLMKSLPYDPVVASEIQTETLPQETEAERLVVQRIGQDIFRAALVNRWGPACLMTGLTDPALLRASHIKASADCSSAAERLDPENGILLSALWDVAFNRELVGFGTDGKVIFAASLSDGAQAFLTGPPLTVTTKRACYLAQHRTKWELSDSPSGRRR